jgi:hypothetical protein
MMKNNSRLNFTRQNGFKDMEMLTGSAVMASSPAPITVRFAMRTWRWTASISIGFSHLRVLARGETLKPRRLSDLDEMDGNHPPHRRFL